jgi:hypothetical protein
MKIHNRKYLGGGKLALILLAVALLIGFANATWVHQVFTQGDTPQETTFTPTVTGSHYHQAQAPASGDIVSIVSHNGDLDRLEISDGVCKRGTITLSTSWSEPCVLRSWCPSYYSGTGQAWVADVNNVNLPSCSGQQSETLPREHRPALGANFFWRHP